jgi:hypothetical protein
VASDADSVIRSVHVRFDDRTPKAVNPGRTWSFAFDMSKLGPGQHQITAFA